MHVSPTEPCGDRDPCFVNDTWGFITPFDVDTHTLDFLESANVTERQRRDESNSELQQYEVYLYVTIGIIGILDNGFVIVVLCSSRTLRRQVVNTFLINQSLIDLVTSLLLAATAQISSSGEHYGIIGELFCRIWANKALLWASFLCSTCNLVAITLERYLAICHPIWHKTKITYKHICIAIVIVWLIGPVVNILTNVIPSDARNGQCYSHANWPAPWVMRFTGVCTFIIQFFFPLVIMIVVHIRMALAFRVRVAPSSCNNDASKSAATSRREENMLRVRKNILRTLFLVCICFTLCWIWNQIFFLLYNLGVSVDFKGIFYHFTVYAASVNCIINPFVYAAQYPDFQQQVKQLLGKATGRDDDSTADVHTDDYRA